MSVIPSARKVIGCLLEFDPTLLKSGGHQSGRLGVDDQPFELARSADTSRQLAHLRAIEPRQSYGLSIYC